jgi:hypothetical protein
MKQILTCILLVFLSACMTTQAEKKSDTVSSFAEVADTQKYFPKNYHVGPRPTDTICADFNGDGYPDIATSLKKQSLAVLLNDQKGNFHEPAIYDTFPHNTSLAAADIDGDGDIDLIPLTETMLGPVFLNDGKGNFTRHDINVKVPAMSWHVESADLDNDHLPDFIITSLHKPVVTIVKNKGNLNFETQTLNLISDLDTEKVEKEPRESGEAGIDRLRFRKRIRALDNAIKDFVVTDINGDSFKDIILPSYLMNVLYVLVNDGKGHFDISAVKFETRKKHDIEYAFSSVAVLNYPDRRLPDIAVANETDGVIYIFGNDNGSLSLKETVDTNSPLLLRIRSDDMNGDGLPDLVATFAAPIPQDSKSSVQVWLNSRKGFVPGDILKSDGFGAYISTCRISGPANPALVISNIHEETLTVLSPTGR